MVCIYIHSMPCRVDAKTCSDSDLIRKQPLSIKDPHGALISLHHLASKELYLECLNGSGS